MGHFIHKLQILIWNKLEHRRREGEMDLLALHFRYILGSICPSERTDWRDELLMKDEAERLLGLIPCSPGHLLLKHASSPQLCGIPSQTFCVPVGFQSLWALSPGTWHLETRPQVLHQNEMALGQVHIIRLNCDYGILSQTRGLSGSVQRVISIWIAWSQILQSYLGN